MHKFLHIIELTARYYDNGMWHLMTAICRILKVIASYTVGIILAILLAIVAVVLAPAIYIWARRFINELLASWKDAEAFKQAKQIN